VLFPTLKRECRQLARLHLPLYPKIPAASPHCITVRRALQKIPLHLRTHGTSRDEMMLREGAVCLDGTSCKPPTT
jgi:hypothetical protein